MTKEEQVYMAKLSRCTPEELIDNLKRFGYDSYYEPYVSWLHKEILRRLKAEKQSTVDAIPVEWIKQWEEKYNKNLEPWFQGRTAVTDMLEDWEKGRKYEI